MYDTGSGGGGGYTPRIRFEAIGEAWGLLQKNLGTWILASLVYVIIAVVIVGIPAFSQQPDTSISGIVSNQLISSFFGLVAAGFEGVLTGGMVHMALKQLRGEPIAFSDVFSAGPLFVPLALAGVLMSLGSQVAVFACILPSLLVTALWMLTTPLIVEQGLTAIDAMRTSWNTIKPELWPAVGLTLVVGLLVAAGAIVCGVGALVTIPLMPLTYAIVYRDFFPTREGGVE